jgi:hypothetical protein
VADEVFVAVRGCFVSGIIAAAANPLEAPARTSAEVLPIAQLANPLAGLKFPSATIASLRA